MKQLLLTFGAFFFLYQVGTAQPCTTITCPSSLSIPCSTNGVGQSFSALSNYPSSITAQWFAPGGINLSSTSSVFSGSFMSTVNLNNVGTYTVQFYDGNNACVMTKTISVTSTANLPTFSALTINNYTLTCINQPVQINILNAQTMPPGGSVSYAVGPVSVTPVFSNSSFLSTSACGAHYIVVRDNVNLCTASYNFNITCLLNPSPTVAIFGPPTPVCIGSSANLIATGANSYTWNTGATSNIINVLPTAFNGTTNIITVTGTGPFGCTSSASYTLTADTTCAMVWPGDANSDGVVNSNDVFEIGLAFNATGPARIPGGNAYTAQLASNWTGNISSGKNKNHADCNGDGTINNNDTVAIYNNYLLTHSFKGSNSTSSNSDISIVTSQNFATIGAWNVADIILGSNTSPLSQLYGTAFDVNFDPSQMEVNGAYLVYTPSFLSASSQDVRFRRSDFTNGQVHAAVVRVNGQNASGNGKIGEFYYKPKSNLPVNTVINLSISGGQKVSSSGVNEGLTAGATSVVANNMVVGLNTALAFQNTFGLFPNPASDQLILQSGKTTEVIYTMLDIVGREIAKGTFTNSKVLDLSGIESGTYLFKFESGQNSFYKKVIVKN